MINPPPHKKCPTWLGLIIFLSLGTLLLYSYIFPGLFLLFSSVCSTHLMKFKIVHCCVVNHFLSFSEKKINKIFKISKLLKFAFTKLCHIFLITKWKMEKRSKNDRYDTQRWACSTFLFLRKSFVNDPSRSFFFQWFKKLILFFLKIIVCFLSLS